MHRSSASDRMVLRRARARAPAARGGARALAALLPRSCCAAARPLRVLRGRAVGLRRSGRADAHRGAERRRARPAAPGALARADPAAALGALAGAQHAARSRERRSPRTTTSATSCSRLFLDDTMMYSCAVFEPPERDARAGLAGQARARLPKLELRPGRSRAGDRHRLGRASPSMPPSATAAA